MTAGREFVATDHAAVVQDRSAPFVDAGNLATRTVGSHHDRPQLGFVASRDNPFDCRLGTQHQHNVSPKRSDIERNRWIFGLALVKADVMHVDILDAAPFQLANTMHTATIFCAFGFMMRSLCGASSDQYRLTQAPIAPGSQVQEPLQSR